MPTYAKNTDVSTISSRGEIERTLQRYGATAFMYGWDGPIAVIGFQIHGLRYKVTLPLPERNSREFTHTPSRGNLRSAADANAAWEQACRQRWRALALWVKAVLEAAEAGITTLEIALQPYILLPNGRTAGEWLAPQIEAAYQSGRMPALLLPGE